MPRNSRLHKSRRSRKSRKNSRRYAVHSKGHAKPVKKKPGVRRKTPEKLQYMTIFQPTRRPRPRNTLVWHRPAIPVQNKPRSTDLKPAGRGRKWLRDLGNFKKNMTNILDDLSSFNLTAKAEKKVDKIDDLMKSLSIKSIKQRSGSTKRSGKQNYSFGSKCADAQKICQCCCHW